MPTPTEPPVSVAGLRRRLAALRARVRRLVLLAGTSRVLAVAAAAAALFFLADWTLDLPLAVRRFVRLGLLDRPSWLPALAWIPAVLVAAGLAVVLGRRGRAGGPGAPTARLLSGVLSFVAAGIPGVLAWAAARHLLDPLRVALPDEDLALSVEERHHALEERLVSALDFERSLTAPGGPPSGESAAMMEAVVEDARRAAAPLEFATVARSRAAWRRAGVAAAAVGAVALGALLLPGPVGRWYERSVLLKDVAWPRATTIVAVVDVPGEGLREKDPAEPYLVGLGRPLAVLARVEGRVPSEAFLLDRLPGSDAKPLRQRLRPVPSRPGLFEAEIRDVREPFEFTLVAGDDEDGVPRYSVSVRVPPRILSIAADLEYPSYLGLPPRRVEGGALDVPEGTAATVSFETDADAAVAEALVDEQPVAVEGGPRSHRFRLKAERTTRFRLRIVTRDGRENDPADATYSVTVRPDAPPRPEWVHPRAPVEATPSARVPLFARTLDDHGVAALRLEVRVGSAAPTSVALEPRRETAGPPGEANDRPYPSRSILSYVPLEVAALRGASGEALVPPARLSVRVVATDTKGQETQGEWTGVDVLRADEVERSLSQRRNVVKGDLLAVRAEVAAVRETVAGLAAAPIGDPERTALREAQFRLSKAKGDLERAARALANVFDAYVYGRMGAEGPNEKILSLLDARHRLLFAQPPDGGGAGEPGAAGGATGPSYGDEVAAVFPWSLYEDVVRARRDRVVFDTGVLDKMIAALEPVLESVVEDAPAATAATAEAASAGTPSLAGALAAHAAWLDALDRALAAMEEWQSLSDLVLELRRIIEEQEALHGRIESSSSPPADGGRRDEGGGR